MMLQTFFSVAAMLATAAAKKPCKHRPISSSHSIETFATSSAVPTVAPTVVSKSATSLLVQTRLSTSTTLESTQLPTATALKSKASKSSASSKFASSTTEKTTEATSSAEDSEVFIGLGTRYGGSCTEEDCWQSGACSFSGYDLPANVDGSTCVSEDIWNNGANCGGCIEVSYKGKTITVMVSIYKEHHKMIQRANILPGNEPDRWQRNTSRHDSKHLVQVDQWILRWWC